MKAILLLVMVLLQGGFARSCFNYQKEPRSVYCADDTGDWWYIEGSVYARHKTGDFEGDLEDPGAFTEDSNWQIKGACAIACTLSYSYGGSGGNIFIVEEGLTKRVIGTGYNRGDTLFLEDGQIARDVSSAQDGSVTIYTRDECSLKCSGCLLNSIRGYYPDGALRTERDKQNSKCEQIEKGYYASGQLKYLKVYTTKNVKLLEEKEYFEDGRLAGTATYKNEKLVGYKKCTDGRQGSESLDCTRPPVKK